jgi:sulfide:quinone oxidoreductase
MTAHPTPPLRVVIAGGGVAGVEALLALHDLAGDRVTVTMIAAEPSLAYRPLAVGEPFLSGRVSEYPLAEIAREHGASLIVASVEHVDTRGHTVSLSDGGVIGYDVLAVCVGCRAERHSARGLSFAGSDQVELMNGLLADIEGGYTRRLVFLATEIGWPLPLYELALMTARRAYDAGVDTTMALVTPESSPLGLFGPEAGAAVSQLLQDAGIEIIAGQHGTVAVSGHVVLEPSGRIVRAERVVTLPDLRGPRVSGLEGNADGFLEVDEHGRVVTQRDIYAAGDGTAFPIKQGGLATQQADAVAEAIAERSGADVTPAPFTPVLRGMLLTGAAPCYLHRDAAGASQASEHPLWWPPGKIAGRYLTPYLDRLDGHDATALPPTDGLAVDHRVMAVSVPPLGLSAVPAHASQADADRSRGS